MLAMAMIIGAHTIIYSTNPEADRAFFRDVLELTHVDASDGWLIFGLPPAEMAVHPAKQNGAHEFYLMCDDVNSFIAAMGARSIPCGPVENQGWGLLTRITLLGGGKLGVYQPRHVRPKSTAASKGRGGTRRSAGKALRKKPKRRPRPRR